MKPAETAQRLGRLCSLARVIIDLTHDCERDTEEFCNAMIAIAEIATNLHDHLDAEIRRIDTIGVGFIDEVRARLDERPAEVPQLRAAK